MDKQEQKKILIDMMKSDEELGLYDDTEINRIELICKDCSDSLEDCACIKSTIDFPKQDIEIFINGLENPSEPNDKLKQAFEKYSEYLEDFENKNTYESGFKDGAKWQQERSYSEEEMLEFGEFIFKNTLLVNVKGVEGILKQFKKK
jgi:hypothetical protein